MTFRLNVYSPKGGSTKSTLAIHIASRLALDGRRVLLVDADPQGSALTWAWMAEQVRAADNAGPLPFVVGRGAASGFDYVITDHSPAELAVLPSADLFVVPVCLDGMSLAPGLRTLKKLRDAGHAPLIVASKVRKDRSEHRQALLHPDLAGALIVADRAHLANFFSTGRTVYDPAHGRDRAVALARAEIDAVVNAVQERLEPTIDLAWVKPTSTAGQEVRHGS